MSGCCCRPGVQVDLGKVRLYGDVELPIYQRVNGNQLVAASPLSSSLVSAKSLLTRTHRGDPS